MICLTDGHGEWDLAGPEGESLRGVLTGMPTRCEPAGGLAETERCAVTAIVGPSRGFLPREASALRSRLERGGRLLVLLDASVGVGGDASKGLGTLLARGGLEVGAAPARETDPSRLYEPGVPPLVVGIASAGFEPAGDLAGQPVALLQAAGVRAISEATRVLPVIESAESTVIDGWGGGALLGAAAEVGACEARPDAQEASALGSAPSTCGRIVVLGASTSSSRRSPPGRRPRTWRSWFRSRGSPFDRAPMAPVSAERVRLFLDAGTLHRLWWWLVVAMPWARRWRDDCGRSRRGARRGGGPTEPLRR